MSRIGSETLTIVFTDLVDSTTTRSELGEEEADRLGEAHMAMLAGVVERHDGRLVKRTGDGVLAVFDSAVHAIDAAVAMQQEAERYSRRPGAIASTEIRIGISTGDVTWDGGGDVAGAAAVEAKRLEAAAAPRQILCAELTKLIARGRGGHVFAGVGELDLKGFPEPVPASEVLWEPRAVPAEYPLPPALATEPDHFVGRDVELEVATAAVAVAPNAPLSLVVIAGEPGIGKTTLATVVGRAAHDNGRVVLFGRCDPQLNTPYRPVAEAIDHWARLTGSDGVDDRFRRLGRVSSVVAGLLGAPPPEDGDAAVAQLALFDTVRDWCAEVRPVLILDDLQWASEQTVLLLRHLLQSPEPAPAVLVATVRAAEQPDHLRTCIDDAVARDRATVVALEGLDPEDIRRLTGSDAPVALAERTGGNPLFLRALTSGDDTAVSVEAAVARRVRLVDEEVQSILRAGAVAGFEFEPSLLATVLEMDEDDVLARLDTAVQAGLVSEREVDRFAFSHGLVQEALARHLGRTRQARLHLRLALAIEASDPSRVVELARHFDAAGEGGKAIEYLTLAARRADELVDWESSERLHRRLEALHTDPRLQLRHQWRALWAAQHLRWMSAEMYEEAMAVSRRAHELGELEIEVLSMSSTTAFINQTGRRASVDHITQLDPGSIADPELRLAATAIGTYAEFIVGRRSPDECWDRMQSVRHLVEGSSLELQRQWYAVLALTQMTAGRLDRSRASFESLFDLYRHHRPLHFNLAVVPVAVSAHLMAGDVGEAERTLQLVLGIVEEVAHIRHEPFGDLALDGIRVVLFHLAGRFEEAHALADAIHAETENVELADSEGIYGMQKFMVLREQGRIADFAAPVRLLARLDPQAAQTWRPGLAAMEAELGMVSEARATVRAVLDTGLPSTADARHPSTLAFLADAIAVTGDVEAAASVEELLLPMLGLHIVVPTAAYFGPASRHLGLLAQVRGDTRRAIALLEQAICESQAAPTPVYEARASVDLAEVLASSGRTADAIQQARNGFLLADRLGMTTVAERARAVMSGSRP